MKTRNIPLPKSRRASTWQIPIVEGTEEREAMKDFAKYEDLLLAYGFRRALATRSIRHQYVGQYKAGWEPPVEDHVLWYHPAGLLAKGYSYTRGGHDGVPSTMPPSKRLGAITLTALLDLGTGQERQHRAAVGLSGQMSGGVDSTLDGRDIRSVSYSIHSNQGSLRNFLIQTQEHGRFLPFSQWDLGYHPMLGGLRLAPEMAVPLEECPSATPDEVGAFIAKRNTPENQARLAEQLPEEIRCIYQHTEHPGSRKKPPVHRQMEPVMARFTEALFFAGKRWINDFNSGLLCHWARAAMGETGDTPGDLRAYEKGPAGLSLPVALLYARQDSFQADRLLGVLRAAPLDVLGRWAKEPDAAGYTLGLHAINRIFVDRGMTDATIPVEKILEILDVLYQRLGAEGLPMATDTRSVLGLPLQFNPSGMATEESEAGARSDFTRIVEALDEWGLDWHVHLRWRNYPNLYKKEEGKPRFFSEDGPVPARLWLDEMGKNNAPEWQCVANMLRAKELGLALPGAKPARQRARI